MKIFFYTLLTIFFFSNLTVKAQSNENNIIVVKDSISKPAINPLAPAKAAFYSAIVPGLGQAYNKKYWKIPIVYAAIGSGIYFYSTNNTKYHQYRDAYKRRLAGYKDDDFQYLDDSRLIAGQKYYQKNRDLSVLVTVGFYVLNILDANVDAHLLQFNVNNNLTIKPDIYQNDLNYKQNVGLTFNYHF